MQWRKGDGWGAEERREDGKGLVRFLTPTAGAGNSDTPYVSARGIVSSQQHGRGGDGGGDGDGYVQVFRSKADSTNTDVEIYI